MTLDPNLYPDGAVRRQEVNVQEETGAVVTPAGPTVVAPAAPVVVPTAVTPAVPAAVAPVEEERVAASAGGIEHRERVVRDGLGVEHGESYVRDVEGERRNWLYTLSQVVWFLLGVVEILIGLRVLLKAIGANPNNGFAQFIYSAGGFFAWPFLGLTGSPASGNIVIEIPSLIAMIVYAIVAWGVVQLIWMFYRPITRGGSTYDRFRA